MNSMRMTVVVLCIGLGAAGFITQGGCRPETPEPSAEKAPMEGGIETAEQKDRRMAWWREARFGLFIHWGLYAIPAGEWRAETNHAEWIRHTAQIPIEQYDAFAPRFNPVAFNADEWVGMAEDAGMKYIVITSKHHDGFCLFDSQLTDYDVMDATPFRRDIMRELADACRRRGIRICWYHSIMDWHHPDYLPRRGWESRSAEGSDLERYIAYMKGQVEELLTNYGKIGVMWFDGEWESTWTPEYGRDLYRYVRALQPDIIVNNRVSTGRAGMAGTFDPQAFSGDFGTPEQQIPATGLDYDWETCMTMNDHWGYNRNDDNWKSVPDLIRKLVDIASKGGNFLLNVGPTAEGLFPPESVERLAAIGRWMRLNGESIYGTTASVFEDLKWGRCTVKPRHLYLHVFDWPGDGRLQVPGLISPVEKAFLMAEPDRPLSVSYQAGSAVVSLPSRAPDPVDSVVVLRFREKPEVINTPRIQADGDIFIEEHTVVLSGGFTGVDIRYTLDGSPPSASSPLYDAPITLKQTATLTCQAFREAQPVSAAAQRRFRRVTPRPASPGDEWLPGLEYVYYEGDWERLPDFTSLEPTRAGTLADFDLTVRQRPENFALRYSGFIRIPTDGVYVFTLVSDDGSRLFIGGKMVVDNDGLHGAEEVSGRIALQSGYHPLTAEYFQRTGGTAFEVLYRGPGFGRMTVPAAELFRAQH